MAKNHQADNHLYKALEKKYESDIASAKSTMIIYFDNPVAIGEHPQHIQEIDKLIGKMSNDELCDEFRYKLSLKIKTSKKGDSFKVLPKKEMDKRKGVVTKDITGKVRKVTSKSLDERDEYRKNKDRSITYDEYLASRK